MYTGQVQRFLRVPITLHFDQNRLDGLPLRIPEHEGRIDPELRWNRIRERAVHGLDLREGRYRQPQEVAQDLRDQFRILAQESNQRLVLMRRHALPESRCRASRECALEAVATPRRRVTSLSMGDYALDKHGMIGHHPKHDEPDQAPQEDQPAR
jgi:hypothetical protein